ncbi:SDR family NAD(P)-dependent oxidoreductase [Micromonospora sp. NPDC051543]|uniref:type I polyketide synthase n=1 Tax=Micromonospora sp. NPDC051543 TaxID=3364287 RepID=UPI0037A9AD15
MNRIAIVGMACRYPDAASPRELWENAVAGRRAFRRLPDVRMNLEDYWDADPAAPDRFYAQTAAVIEGYEFDRLAYRIAGSTYRSTDLTHWLALDMAALALADAGFPAGQGLPRQRTGVVVGNTLTGEFSRANLMRLRWPYVRRTLAAALSAHGWEPQQLAAFLADYETSYKSPFPAVDEDTLAGGLSNTIAGRICNYFDLNGGGYTVDGACSSSLLSVVTACRNLADGELDVALAGGVDLSIDPFEIIGFAKTGALARSEMRVYDRGSNGFWPGEGCGMVVLMREADAHRAGHRVYATIAGWGISSDGKGGITRPEVDGYRLALRRAYERAGFGIDTVSLFEGHGTGTAVGDATELRALTLARRAADPAAAPAAISSIKGMIGHTKAAAGVAGLIKATLAVYEEVLPPSVGTVAPHDLLTGEDTALRALRKAEPWPDGAPVRAGVTAMGFGGINTHLVLDQGGHPRRRGTRDASFPALAASFQDTELLLVDGASTGQLRERLTRLIDFVPQLSYAQLGDLAITLHDELRDLPHRAAVVVSSPQEAQRQLRVVRDVLDTGETSLLAADGRAFLHHVNGPGRIGFLFPGQGSGRGTSGGALRRRFAEVEQVYLRADLPVSGDMVATAVAQPRIITGSLAGLRAMSQLGLNASVAVGHSLGEIAALQWAGAMDEETAIGLAGLRGATMSRHSASGTMASIGATADVVRLLLAGQPVVIAGYNGPNQTVVAGSVPAIQAVCQRAREAGLSCARLSVSHAFHSDLVAPAADAFADALPTDRFAPLGRRVVSTVTGEVLAPETDLAGLLRRQITEPVLFSQAVALAGKDIELFVEVGPGQVLSRLAAEITDVPAVALDTDDESLGGLLRVAGAAYVIGASGDLRRLFESRVRRPLDIDAELRFFASPCEAAPAIEAGVRALPAPARPVADAAAGRTPGVAEPAIEVLRRLAAARAELPIETVRPDSLLLDDLHLSSITVGQLVNQVAQELGLSATQAPTTFATATVGELAQTLDELTATSGGGPAAPTGADVAGAAPWARAFSVELTELPEPPAAAPEADGPWLAYARRDHPLAGALRAALERGGVGSGVLVCLPEECTEADLELARQGARAALTRAAGDRFVLVQHGRGAAGLAKTLRLEAPWVRTTVVHAPAVPESVDRIVAEVAATTGFTEVLLGPSGVRRVPTLRALPVGPARVAQPLGAQDVLLVTGGGKGITAECALAVAADTGASLGLLGRSDPQGDAELTANLRRMTDAGVRVHYARADVTDPAEVRRAVAEVTAALGPVTAVLHGAGGNVPAALSSLDAQAFRQTIAPKIDGLRAVLDAVEPERLRLLVTFGSIIGRAGLRGEAHYATANEWLAELTDQFAAAHPLCRTLCLEWSVWSGVGMGERLSVVEGLYREGVTPISLDAGVQMMRRLVADPEVPSVVVVSGRTEGIDTVRRELPELPLLRFVQQPLIYYPGIELVTEVELNAGTDRYLTDHLLDGNLLFPAVFGLEAMAQVATAVTGRGPVRALERLEFRRPIVVPADGGTTIRIAATVTGDDTVAVTIRSSETGYAADHFAAELRFGTDPVPAGPPEQVAGDVPPVPLDPAADLYNGLLFQGPRFHRLRRYHRVAARHVDVDVASDATVDWFAAYLPGELLLGDPGTRDALMHGNQVCVPHATLLPAGIDRILLGPDRPSAATALRFSATERARDGDTYTYDIAVRTATGEVVERWEGLRLQAVRKGDGRGPWPAALLGPYLERVLDDLFDARIAVAVEPAAPTGADTGQRRRHSALAAARALGERVEIRYRPDGRPEIPGDRRLSLSHGAGSTLCVAATTPVGCDVEPVAARSPQDWAGLLGGYAGLARLVATEAAESADTAGTRVWSAAECLRKLGLLPPVPLTLVPPAGDGWVVLTGGGIRIATLVTTVHGVAEPVVFAVALDGRR